MAPEIHEYLDYDGKQIDLFAAGMLLFIFKSLNPPFKRAAYTDKLY